MSGETKWPRGPYLLSDRTVYRLTDDKRQNAFWASVQTVGRTEKGEASVKEAEAVAALFAESPAMANLLECMSRGSFSPAEWVAEARAILAKIAARGETREEP